MYEIFFNAEKYTGIVGATLKKATICEGVFSIRLHR